MIICFIVKIDMRNTLIIQGLAGAFLLLCLSVTGCRKEEDLVLPDFDKSGEVLKAQEGNPTDKWISENLTKPYNIQILWRWDYKMAGYKKNFIPPLEENVLPYAKIIKTCFLDTYTEVAGNSFIKPLVPKQFLMLGEWGYNKNGTITLGQAESGRMITFFGVNHWNELPDEGYPWIREAVHTTFHEFGHILHQTKLYSKDFQTISKQYYTDQWNNEKELDARKKGFISTYAMSTHNEDFVEIIAFYTTLTPKAFKERTLEGIQATAKDVEKATKKADEAASKAADAKVVAEKLRKAATAAIEAAKSEGTPEAEKKAQDLIAKANAAIAEAKTAESAATTAKADLASAIEADKKANACYQDLLHKITMVKEYLKSSWNVDLDLLRDKALANAAKAFADPSIFPGASAPLTGASFPTTRAIVSPYAHNCHKCNFAGATPVANAPGRD